MRCSKPQLNYIANCGHYLIVVINQVLNALLNPKFVQEVRQSARFIVVINSSRRTITLAPTCRISMGLPRILFGLCFRWGSLHAMNCYQTIRCTRHTCCHFTYISQKTILKAGPLCFPSSSARRCLFLPLKPVFS